MDRKWLVLLALALLSCQCRKEADKAPDPAAAAQAAAELDRKVILAIDGIRRSNRDLKSFIRLHYDDSLGREGNDRLLSRLFDVFQEQQLLLFKAAQEGISVGDDEIESFLAGARARGQGEPPDREAVRDALRAQKCLLATAYRDLDVPEAEIAAYYEQHPDEYRRGEEIELRQILLKDREKLLQLRAELVRRPERFEEVARAESAGPEADKGGAMGSFEKGVLPREMEEVVFSLQDGEISPIVESPYGFHLFRVLRRRRARTQPLAAVQEEIRGKLLSAKLAVAHDEFIRALRAEVPLSVHPENLFFAYKNPDPGENENESKNLPGPGPVPGG